MGVGGVGGKKGGDRGCSARGGGTGAPLGLGAPSIRENDSFFCQRWREHLLDIGHERGSIHRTIDDIRCSQAVDAQARNERQRFPVAVRDTRDEALATRSATEWRTILVVTDVSSIKNEPLAP